MYEPHTMRYGIWYASYILRKNKGQYRLVQSHPAGKKVLGKNTSRLKVSQFRDFCLVSSFRPKQQQKYCKDFCSEIFCSFLGASWKLFGLTGGNYYVILLKSKPTGSPPNASRKPQGSYKNFHGRNPYNIFVAILGKTMTPKRHFEIN